MVNRIAVSGAQPNAGRQNHMDRKELQAASV
jgi:hypothetical protein